MAGDAQHGHIVENIEVIFGDAPLRGAAGVFDLDRLEAEFGDQAAKIGIGVVEFPENIHDAAVVEAEAVEITGQLDFRQPLDEVIIALANGEHQRRFAAAGSSRP